MSAANACAEVATVGIYFCIAADCNIAARPPISAANACTAGAAIGIQCTVPIRIRDGQIAAVILFYTGMINAALGSIVTVQFDGHAAVSPCGNSGLALATHIDVHIGDGDLSGLFFLRLDGDGIRGRSRIAVRLVDDGFGGLLFLLHAARLGDILVAVRFCFHGDAALCQIIGFRQCAQGHGCCQQQGQCDR